MAAKESRLASWLIIFALVAVVGGCVAAFLLMQRSVAEPTNARAMAALVQTDPAQAEEKFLNRWFRVDGVVQSGVLVQEAEEPFAMLDLDTGQPLEVKAAFPERELADLKAGTRITFEGQCILCQPGVLYFERCRLVSKSEDKADK